MTTKSTGRPRGRPRKTPLPIGIRTAAQTGNATDLVWPATLPIEIALKVAPLERILDAYGIHAFEWEALRNDPLFKAEVERAAEMLKQEGMSFRTKARLQAEELLRTSWKIIHDDTMPANVRADLLKFTVRVAGYDVSKDGGPTQNGLQININLA